MDEVTIFVKEATSGPPIQKIEQILNQLDGIERVLVDTADGEIKIEYNDDKITTEQIGTTLKKHRFHI